MNPNSLSWRLAFWTCALGVLLVSAAMGISYWMLMRQLDYRAQEHLEGKLEQVRYVLEKSGSIGAIKADSHGLANLMEGQEELSVAIAQPYSGLAIAGFGRFAGESLSRAREIAGQVRSVNAWNAANENRMLSISERFLLKDGESVDVIVTEDRWTDDKLQTSFFFTMLPIFPLMLALAMLGASWISRYTLKSVSRLRHITGTITTHDLSYRLSSDGLPAELVDLADSFNRMLARLEEGVTRLFQFSGDLAHEMRTPISNLLGKTQVTLSRVRSADEYLTVLESNTEELVRLGRLVEDMLFLAQADHAQGALKREPVDLTQEAAQVAEFFESLAQDLEVAIKVEGQGAVHGDKTMIRRAISNLISNAIRHTPRGKQISVQILTSPGPRTVVSVSNPGEPLAPEHLPRLFERFFRADSSRPYSQGGTGLGLAIVKSIMTLHGGHATVENEPGGVITFRLIFEDQCSMSSTSTSTDA